MDGTSAKDEDADDTVHGVLTHPQYLERDMDAHQGREPHTPASYRTQRNIPRDLAPCTPTHPSVQPHLLRPHIVLAARAATHQRELARFRNGRSTDDLLDFFFLLVE